MDSFLDWQGWRGLEVVIICLAIPSLLWIWSKLDSVLKSANHYTSAQVANIMTQFMNTKADADKIHAEQWSAINAANQQALRLMEQLHAHELFVRDNYPNNKMMEGAIATVTEKLDLRFDSLEKELNSYMTAVQHLANIKRSRRG